MSSSCGHTKCTAEHRAIPSKRSPETRWVTPIHQTKGKIPMLKWAGMHPTPAQRHKNGREPTIPSFTLGWEGLDSELHAQSFKMSDRGMGPQNTQLKANSSFISELHKMIANRKKQFLASWWVLLIIQPPRTPTVSTVLSTEGMDRETELPVFTWDRPVHALEAPAHVPASD